jgi:hypothetical protein
MDKMSDIHGYKIGYERISVDSKDKTAEYDRIRCQIYLDTIG